jgi:hypothetical protein
MFESVPSNGERCNLFHCFNGEMKNQDKGIQVIKEMKKWAEERRWGEIITY